jgi:hypothetical protein
VRLGDLGKGEGLRDREREPPGLDQLADVAERILRWSREQQPLASVSQGILAA